MAQKHNISDTEYPMTRMGIIQQPSRRYRRLRHPSFTAAVWTANNPLLQRGEFGSEIDTGKLKIGDGVTYWNDLGYVAASEIAFADITGSPDDNVALKNALDAKQDVLTEGTGIDIDSDNIISNTGVRSVATGTTNGTISVNTGGTSAEVAVYGLGSAAYTSSSDYATAAQGALADKAANKDLSNLTSTGANISNWSSNVSNCLTEIPQDIKLELNNGTLTLKAGSVLTDPQGGTQRTTTEDKTGTLTTNGQYMVFADRNNGALQLGSGYTVEKAGSGSTLPADGSTFNIFYNSTDGKIYRWTGSAWVVWGVAFPLGIITVSNNAISSIDQVFNGFGYIGSTVFALPGVKGLAPNSRNADGTLKSVVIAINSVITRTFAATGALYIGLQATGFGGITKSNYSYDPNTNIQYSSGIAFSNSIVFASCDMSSGVISNWTVLKNNPFHAVDYSDTEYMAHQARPSNRYVDLTLPASGGTITAPADGYLYVAKLSGNANEFIRMTTPNAIGVSAITPAGSMTANLTLSVSKGDVITVSYNLSGTTNSFRFVYANGAK